MKTFIYTLCNPDGSVFYVGKTIKPKVRMYRHYQDSREGKRRAVNMHIRRLMAEGHKPTMKIVQECDGDGCAEEIALIQKLYSEGVILTNGTLGGEGTPGYKPSPEQRAASSVRQKERWKDPEFRKKCVVSGWHHTPEIRQKWSKMRKGRPRDPEAVEKGRQKLIGIKRSPEFSRRMSEVHKGKIVPPEHIARITELARIKNTGKKHTAESKAKMSIALKGRPSKLRGIPKTRQHIKKILASRQVSAAWWTGIMRRAQERRKETRERDQPMISDYLGGMTAQQLGEKYGVHKRQIYTVLARNNIPPLNLSKRNNGNKQSKVRSSPPRQLFLFA